MVDDEQDEWRDAYDAQKTAVEALRVKLAAVAIADNDYQNALSKFNSIHDDKMASWYREINKAISGKRDTRYLHDFEDASELLELINDVGAQVVIDMLHVHAAAKLKEKTKPTRPKRRKKKERG